MSIWRRALEARQVIGKQWNVLQVIDARAATSGDFRRARDRFGRWKHSTARLLAENVNPDVGKELEATFEDFDFVMDVETLHYVKTTYEEFILLLLEKLKYSPGNVMSLHEDAKGCE